MALNGKYVSCFEVIRNVFRDTGTTDLNWQDAVEWCFESIELIGIPQTYRDEVAIICVNDYRGDLPCDLRYVTQVAGYTKGGLLFPMRHTNDSLHPVFECKLGPHQTIAPLTPATDIDNSPYGNSTFAVDSQYYDTNTPIGQDANGNPTFNFMNDENVTLSKYLAGTASVTSSLTDATYRINDNYIFTSFRDGYGVIMAYKAFPIDEKGFPMIPDDTKFKMAVKCYITMKLDYIAWRRNLVPKDVYEHSEREWAWYCGAATTKGRIPTYDQMQSIAQNILRLIPKINLHDNFYATLGSKERLLFGRKY